MKRKPNIRAAAQIRWALVIYDVLIFASICAAFYAVYKETRIANFTVHEFGIHASLALLCLLTVRVFLAVYRQIWRYGGVQSYCRLILADAIAFCIFFLFDILLPITRIAFILALPIACTTLLACLVIRMVYRYAYKRGVESSRYCAFLRKLIDIFSFGTVHVTPNEQSQKIHIAIVGAGTLGTSLAEELTVNQSSPYEPVCFFDDSPKKYGRVIHNLPVYGCRDKEQIRQIIQDEEIHEIVVAISSITKNGRKELFELFNPFGCKMKLYDYPAMKSAESGKRTLRSFDIEDLLFRLQVVMENDQAVRYYTGKRILITGGGGSIGSELCRQLAKMDPERLILVDIYENGAYDVQQELRIQYGSRVPVNIEIVSVTNRDGLARVFEEYRPQIVINAAAHKHVPLMEKNCVEAVENNVFGTLNSVELSEIYGVERFIQVSTDKAVNPTNVMGATKRMCEYIVLSHAEHAPKNGYTTTFSATRFGNVLGSAGSVIPLFKKQIANGGPVTITDKQIIRYFMTIPEASQLVLQSGAMAENGELFVLDMGSPVRIYDLAENMIRLSGLEPGVDIQILETGLRPGEKLYEELLIASESLDKTDNKLIFVEKDDPISEDALTQKLNLLREAASTGCDEEVRRALEKAVPTFRTTRNAQKPMDIFDKQEVEFSCDLDFRAAALQDKRVLIVDDLALNRQIATDTLNELGMKAECAENGSSALTMLMRRGAYYYDYLLLDIEMPIMDGISAARQIRALGDGFGKDLRIVAMTGEDTEDRRTAATEAGVDAFLIKPIHIDELVTAFLGSDTEE